MERTKTSNRGSRTTGKVWKELDNEFFEPFILSLKALPAVRAQYRPKFDNVYKRKLMCLFWLQGDQKQNGHFSPFSIVKYYALKDNTWANKYFSRLITEGWIIPIDTHLVTHKRAILSPLFFALLASITTYLRREHPERFAAQDLAAVGPEVRSIAPTQSCFDIVVDIPDMR